MKIYMINFYYEHLLAFQIKKKEQSFDKFKTFYYNSKKKKKKNKNEIKKYKRLDFSSYVYKSNHKKKKNNPVQPIKPPLSKED